MKEFIQFLDKSHSNYHAVLESKKMLESDGFTEIKLENEWKLEKGGKYYLIKGDSSIIAFTIGKELNFENGFKIFASHTDSPTFRVKPNPEVVFGNTLRLNVEVYGGPIINTWYDRVLSLAGRVYLKGSNPFKPVLKLIDIDKDLMTIPNLAIHQNREVNNGVKVDRQKHTLPILSAMNEVLEKENYLIKLIAKELNVNEDEILDFDLFFYLREKAKLVGVNSEMLSAPRIDNLASVYAGVKGIIEAKDEKSINVFIGYDNEEIGSATKQGADSNYLSNVLERIILSLGKTRNEYLRILNLSYIISADGAHAVHPAFVEKSDITNLGMLNKGVQVKISANQRYTSDAQSISILKSLIDGYDVKLQYFLNNSNEVGGSTIGPISSTHLDISSIDIGVPMLAMHSCRELCGVLDVTYLINIAKALFSQNNEMVK